MWDWILPVRSLPQPGQVTEIISGATVEPYCGGGAPNIAVALARLGFSPRLIYPVGQDFPDSECEARWRADGVDLAGIVMVPTERSGFAYLFVAPDQESVCFAFPGAAGVAAAPRLLPFEEFVVVAPVLNAFTQPILEAALAKRCRVVISGIAGRELIPYLAQLTALVINAAEANRLCHLLNLESHSALAAQFPDCLFFITKGAAGSTLYQHKEAYSIPAVAPLRVIDPTGAGDAYAAGVVAGFFLDRNPIAAGRLGATLASFVVEEFGSQTNLPDRAMLRQRMNEPDFPFSVG